MIRKNSNAPPEGTSDSASAPPPSGEVASAGPLPCRIEALLFAAAQPLALRKIATFLDEEVGKVETAMKELGERWSGREGAIELVEIAAGYRFMTRAAFHKDVACLSRKKGMEKLSPAALETLAVVAYRQPIIRADVEAVRGVQCGPLLRVLLDRDLIRITGRSNDPGHPLLYGTTKKFLDHFGLASLKNLPDLKEVLDAT